MDADSLPNQLSDEDMVAPSLDVVFDVLADSRRRFALSYLHDQSTPLAIADLILEIAAHQHETAKNEVPEDVVKRESIAFRHRHLPKLVDANLVAINADRKTVRATDTLHSIEQFLTIAAEIEQ